jgi:hypothetical protein
LMLHLERSSMAKDGWNLQFFWRGASHEPRPCPLQLPAAAPLGSKAARSVPPLAGGQME